MKQPSLHSFSLKHLSTAFFFLWLASLFGCPAPLRDLKAPQSSPKDRIRWLRTTFYQIYLREKSSLTPKDHLRILLRRFPTLSLQTYQANIVHLETQKQKQTPLGDLERYYLLMNLLVEESLPSDMRPKLRQIRQEVKQRFAPPNKRESTP